MTDRLSGVGQQTDRRRDGDARPVAALVARLRARHPWRRHQSINQSINERWPALGDGADADRREGVFNAADLTAVAAHGSLPMISWKFMP